ncbi:MAG: hypothetical protein LUD00_06370 [Prevotellaceae bacterium]|nr:hypothetical protein [Prevotellaceae bacterium]
MMLIIYGQCAENILHVQRGLENSALKTLIGTADYINGTADYVNCTADYKIGSAV